MNGINNSFENLDYHYKPSYIFLDNCGFLKSYYKKDINISDLNNSFEEKKNLFENESNISLQNNYNKSINMYVHRNQNELFYKKFYYDFYNNIIYPYILHIYKLYDSNKYISWI